MYVRKLPEHPRVPVPVLGASRELCDASQLSEPGASIPVLKMKKLRLKGAKQLAQGHAARNPFQAQTRGPVQLAVLATCRGGAGRGGGPPRALTTSGQEGGPGAAPTGPAAVAAAAPPEPGGRACPRGRPQGGSTQREEGQPRHASGLRPCTCVRRVEVWLSPPPENHRPHTKPRTRDPRQHWGSRDLESAPGVACCAGRQPRSPAHQSLGPTCRGAHGRQRQGATARAQRPQSPAPLGVPRETAAADGPPRRSDHCET